MNRQELLKSKYLVREVLFAIGDGVIIADGNGKISFINAAAERITGWQAIDATGTDIDQILNIYDSFTGAKRQNSVLGMLDNKSETGLKDGNVLITNNGERKYLSATFSPIEFPGEDLYGMVIVFRDITKYKLLEQTCRHEESNLRAIFNAAPVAMFIVDKNRVISQINNAALKLLDKRLADIVGKAFGDGFDCVGSKYGCGNGECCAACELRQSIQRAFAGKPNATIEYPQTVLRSKKKETFWFSASVTPFRIADTTKVAVVLENITAKKQQELYLTQSRDFYLSIFDSFPVIVLQSNFAGECMFVNKTWEAFTGQPAEKAQGYGWLDFIFPEDRDNQYAVKDDHLHIKLAEGEMRWFHRSGQYRWLYGVHRPYHDINGSPVGYISINFDITDRKLAEEGLNRYKILSEKAGDIIIFSDLNGAILEANKAALKAYGYTREQINKLFISDLCQVEGEKDIWEAPVNGIFFESTHYRKDGSSFPVEVSAQQEVISGKRVILSIIRDLSERKKAEESLRASEEKFRQLFNNTEDAIFLTEMNPAGARSIIEVNDIACQSLCYSKSELLGMSPQQIVAEEYTFTLDPAANKDESVHYTFETVHVTKNGKRIPVEVSRRMFKLQGKRVWLDVARDITERKKAEHLVRESEAKYRSLFHNLPSLFELVEVVRDEERLPEDFIFLEANSEWEKTLRVTKNEVLGKRYSSLYPEFHQFLKDACIKSIKERGFILVQNKEYYSAMVKLWFVVSVFESGVGHLGIVTENITSRKLAELGERRSQSRYRSLFMNMHNGFSYGRVITNQENKVIDFEFLEINDAYEKFIGLRREDVIGNRFSELYPEHQESYAQHIKMFGDVAFGLIDRAEWEYYSHIANKWLHVAVYSPEKKYFVAITTDISERKLVEKELRRAKDEAEEAVRAKSEFLANMSHEIRTPINGIMGMIELTLQTSLDGEQRENLDTAKSCAISLLRIINDILDFSKMEVGKMIIESINFDIYSLLDELARTHSHRTIAKGLALNSTRPAGLPKMLNGDPGRLRQIIGNLLDNAIKFTDRGSINITVTYKILASEDIELQFAVADTGIGIAPAEMDKLFRTFSQVDGSITRKFGGTGLGLAISKHLVEMMGGKMWVESEKGTGSTFHFTIVFKPPAIISETAVPETAGPQTVIPQSILLVEDDQINRTVTSRMLKELGHKVNAAENGVQALELLKNHHYDLVLMDIQMPEMDGIETTKRIRTMEKDTGAHLPIIALSAHALSGDRDRFMAVGMDEYLAKPVQLIDLLNMIDRISDVTRGFSDIRRIKINEAGDIVHADLDDDSINSEKKAVMYAIDQLIKQIDIFAPVANIAIVEEMSHQIKELANKIGAEELKGAAFKSELAARRGNLSEAIKYIAKIRHIIEIYRKSEIIT